MANQKLNDQMAPPTFLFPSAASQQRISSDGVSLSTSRNKVSLKPGRSLMDWIRLTHSGKDLTGVGSHRLEVTQEELAKHGQADDAWICLKGFVYNITPYMEYHPGGFDELMKGAGKDATDLFNQVHKWVNFESMLEKCLVGRLSSRPINLNKKNPSLESVVQLKVSSPSSPVIPKYDWFQTEKSVNIVIYTKHKEITQDDITVDLTDQVLRASFRLAQNIYTILLDLEGQVLSPPTVKIGKGSGCVEIILLKNVTSGTWSQLGSTQPGHESFVDHQQAEPHYRSCKIIHKKELTHDMFLFSLEPPPGCLLQVGPGRHVAISLQVEGTSVVRSYTPVENHLGPKESSVSSLIYLMIKIYPQGALTPTLHKLTIGDSVMLSDPMGSFDGSILKNYGRLALLAAGTGFTPMVTLNNRFLAWNRKGKVWLMMFNKTVSDIPWKSELDKLASRDQRLTVKHVLSEPCSDWQGERGRIRPHLVEAFLPSPAQLDVQDVEEDDDEDNSRMLICICGPTQFTKTTNSLLLQIGYSPDDIHAFTG